MWSLFRRVLPTTFVAVASGCEPAPENLFASSGRASAAHSGGSDSTDGGRASSGGALTPTGGVSMGAGGAASGADTGGSGTGDGMGVETGGAAPVAGTGGSGAGGSGAGGSALGGQGIPLKQELRVVLPTDDCTWLNGTQERLRFSDSEATLEVGADAETGRIGLRMPLPINRGAHVVSAILRVYRASGNAAETDTLAVQVFESANVPPFNAAHRHGPAGHVPEGLWPMKIGEMPVGKVKQFTESPDLTPLLQHVLDRTDWSPGGAIGFVLAPDTMTGWASYADSSAGSNLAASLQLIYTL